MVFLFLFRSGAPPITLLTAGALTNHRLPATASNVCTTDARLGGVGRVPPKNKKFWSLAMCKSLMYIINRIGPRIDHWGTPVLIVRRGDGDDVPPIETKCDLSDK